jgi:hypothetical protein
MPAYTSPDVRNLSVGSGELSFKPEGAGGYVHLGNCPNFEFKMKTKMLDHHAPINGIKVKDYTWTVELEAEVEIIMEELTAFNLQMLLLGDIGTDGSGHTTVTIAARNSVIGALHYIANNEVGPRWFIDLSAVTFNNDGAFDPITSRKNDFSKISIKGTALAVNGTFGVFTLI